MMNFFRIELTCYDHSEGSHEEKGEDQAPTGKKSNHQEARAGCESKPRKLVCPEMGPAKE
jgi:hypothetical protein